MLLLPLLLIVAVAVLSSNFGVMRGGGEPFQRQAVVLQRLVVCQSSCDVLEKCILVDLYYFLVSSSGKFGDRHRRSRPESRTTRKKLK
jgi:hypothetical protein